MNPVLGALFGTGFTFLMTVLGATVVFFFKGAQKENVQKIFLGFAGGVMIAASIWSLLIPAIEDAKEMWNYGFLIPAIGFLLGGVFFMLADWLWATLKKKQTEESDSLMILAVTLHNIPEGMAVGLAFAMAAELGNQSAFYASAFALAMGIGIQNFPEGAAISLPLWQSGQPKWRAFLVGALSGIVEPIFGMLAFFAAGRVQPAMPLLLSFAAGAMLYVVTKELLPKANRGKRSNLGTMGVMIGFLLMMILDISL